MNKKHKDGFRVLFWSMMKIGCIGFGGGNALIPVLQKDIVDEKKMVDQTEFEKDVVVASITPGALPVEIAGGIGKRLFGWKGMLAGSVGMAFPGVFLTVVLLSVFSYLNDAMLRQIEFLTVGITAFIACLLTDYIVGTLKKACTGAERRNILVVIVGVFALTCGKNLFRLLQIDASPIFALSTVHVFIMAFFVILFAGGAVSKRRICISVVLCMLYIMCVGKNQFIQNSMVYYVVLSIMIILSFYGVRKQFIGYTKLRSLNIRETGKEVAVLATFLAVAYLGTWLIADQAPLYITNGFISSIMSFGGGDAYLTVAEGIFVHSELVSEDIFYGNIVPLVNILPGSILCKTLSGVGFFVGYNHTNNVFWGYLVALAGFVCSIVASCGIFSVVGCIYESFERLEVFQLIKRWIRPIVSGLMFTVILALIYQNRKLGTAESMGWLPVIVMLLIYGLNIFLYYYKKVSNGKIIMISAALSLFLCNISMICF